MSNIVGINRYSGWLWLKNLGV